MNLLKENWIPVHETGQGAQQWIGLKTLLTANGQYEVSLPRDDLEMGALQLLICLVQVLFMPDDVKSLKSRFRNLMNEAEYDKGIAQLAGWFDLVDKKYPFMQVRGVNAKELTPMEKLLPGVDSGTNSNFVNEADLGKGLCLGCTAIALFNQASNAPGFGGGFKAGLRGSTPVTTFVQGRHLRETIWLNVLNKKFIDENYFTEKLFDPPTWVEPIKEKSKFSAASIGFLRGLLWQPAHIELDMPMVTDSCSCCGRPEQLLFTGFNKAKHFYDVEGLWLHPHSPQLMVLKKGQSERKYLAFTTSAPSWTRLTPMIIKQEMDGNNKEGFHPALTVVHAKEAISLRKDNLFLYIGGYRNNQAAILERRHEHLELNRTCLDHLDYISQIIDKALSFKKFLRQELYYFYTGDSKKDLKGCGIKELSSLGEQLFYRRTESFIHSLLAAGDFSADNTFLIIIKKLHDFMKKEVLDIFNQLAAPYLDNPELIRTSGVCKKILFRKIKELAIEEEVVEIG